MKSPLRLLALLALLFNSSSSLWSQSYLELSPEQKANMTATGSFSENFLGPRALIKSGTPEAWLWTNTRDAFAKIMSEPGERGRENPLDRLMNAIQEGPAAKTEIEAILKDHNSLTLNAFFDELYGRINRIRAQYQSLDPHHEAAHIDQLRNQGAGLKLKPTQLAAIIYFYFALAQENSLVLGSPLERSSVHRITNAIRVSSWPGIPPREHGEAHPALPYSAQVQRTFRFYWFAFEALGLDQVWVEMATQLINVNSGNKRFRQVQGLEERVLGLVRELALAGEVQEAKKLFLIYLNNYSSSLDRDQKQVYEEADFDTSSGNMINLSEFLERFSTLTHPGALRRFFETGQLPLTRMYPRKGNRHKLSWGSSLQFASPDFQKFCESQVALTDLPNVKSLQLQRAIAFFMFQNQPETCRGALQIPKE